MSNNEQMIRDAYMEILGRSVDKDGLAYYMSKNLSYYDLCAALKASREYSRNNCLKSRPNRYTQWPFPQIFIVQNIKVVYCPIAKNACSSLKRLMVELSDVERKQDILRRGDIHIVTDSSNTGIQLKDITKQKVNEALESPNYFRFAVLRDPATRLLSAFWEKFVINRHSKGNMKITFPVIKSVQEARGADSVSIDAGITFYDFIKYVCASEPFSLDPHWKPQYTYLRGVEYNKYFDQHNLEPLYQELGSRSGQRIKPTEFNVTNSGKGNYVESAYNLLPGELIEQGPINKKSFFNKEIDEMICLYFKYDFDLISRCVS